MHVSITSMRGVVAKISFCTFRHVFMCVVWYQGVVTASVSLLQEICVSNHTQKLQRRQTVHKGSISQQLFQVEWSPYGDVPVCYGRCASVAHSCRQFKLFQLRNEEEDEAMKNSRVSQERQRTLDRLRTFKQV